MTLWRRLGLMCQANLGLIIPYTILSKRRRSRAMEKSLEDITLILRWTAKPIISASWSLRTRKHSTQSRSSAPTEQFSTRRSLSASGGSTWTVAWLSRIMRRTRGYFLAAVEGGIPLVATPVRLLTSWTKKTARARCPRVGLPANLTATVQTSVSAVSTDAPTLAEKNTRRRSPNREQLLLQLATAMTSQRSPSQ